MSGNMSKLISSACYKGEKEMQLDLNFLACFLLVSKSFFTVEPRPFSTGPFNYTSVGTLDIRKHKETRETSGQY